jgi:fructose-specific phosphotransferase system IIC component
MWEPANESRLSFLLVRAIIAPVKAQSSTPPTFFHGFRPAAKIICVIGACFFAAGFFVKGYEGAGRAIGLLGIGVFLCGMITNLLQETVAEPAGSIHRRHLLTQAIFTSVLAVAVFMLAGYLLKYGTLPKFMPPRYQNGFHVKRTT